MSEFCEKCLKAEMGIVRGDKHFEAWWNGEVEGGFCEGTKCGVKA